MNGIEAVLGHDRDVLISASTAAGKTEAVFLPLLTRAVGTGNSGSFHPLRQPAQGADQRPTQAALNCWTERLELPVAKWHGDAPPGPKARIMKSPAGVVLITPESIEALFLRRTRDAERLFAGLDAIVIDELHAFLQGPRGLHLASLLRRIDLLIGRRVRRIGPFGDLGGYDLRRDMDEPAGARHR
ncbi:MAG: DEAD/DEAH box helicase [Brevundimonas sp.]|nr:DEAD/DEAH box helicase [Brevundimonas sp.]